MLNFSHNNFFKLHSGPPGSPGTSICKKANKIGCWYPARRLPGHCYTIKSYLSELEFGNLNMALRLFLQPETVPQDILPIKRLFLRLVFSKYSDLKFFLYDIVLARSGIVEWQKIGWKFYFNLDPNFNWNRLVILWVKEECI